MKCVMRGTGFLTDSIDWSLGLQASTTVRNNFFIIIKLWGTVNSSIDQDRDSGSLHFQLPIVQ